MQKKKPGPMATLFLKANNKAIFLIYRVWIRFQIVWTEDALHVQIKKYC